MNNLLKSILPNPLPQTQSELINVLRELMQSIALLGLWRARFFEHSAFYGGTALRLLYGLDRFSEDLDFSLLLPTSDFSFDKYSASLQKEMNAYGFDVRFEEKSKPSDSNIKSAFLKTNTYNQLIVIEAPEHFISGINKHSILKIKLEIDTLPPSGFSTEMKYVFAPIQFAVRSYTLPSLFAGKMHALLCRKWKNRVKGRDWYDFIWYISRYPQINLSHLEERMRQSGHYDSSNQLTKDELVLRIYDAIESLDITAARKEVSPFILTPTSLDLWSKEFFFAAADKILVSQESL